MFLNLLLFVASASVIRATAPERKQHTAYTEPMTLNQGEVTNRFHKLSIPKGPIAVYGFKADVVEKDENGAFVPVPIFDAYLHHHVVGSDSFFGRRNEKWSPMKDPKISRAIGFGAGTECRGTPQKFYYPYAFLTEEGEDSWLANVHIINTRHMPVEAAHHCLECPCNAENMWTAGDRHRSFDRCNAQLMQSKNTACFSDTYHGGLRCCEDRAYCLQQSQLNSTDQNSTYYLRYVIDYSPVTSENRPLTLASCCDASGNLTSRGNTEYDIPQCDPSINPDCIHNLTTIQRIDAREGSSFGWQSSESVDLDDAEIDVIYAVGHQHRGALGIHLYDHETGELICSSMPTFGNSDQVGDEKGYLVAMSTCTFDPPLRMKHNAMVRIESIYDSTEAHTGVMGLFYIAIADPTAQKNEHVGQLSFAFIAVASVVSAMFFKMKKYRGYTQID